MSFWDSVIGPLVIILHEACPCGEEMVPMLLPSSGWRPGMLCNKRPHSSVPVLLRLRNPGKYICQESQGVLNAGLSNIFSFGPVMVGPAEEIVLGFCFSQSTQGSEMSGHRAVSFLWSNEQPSSLSGASDSYPVLSQP